MFELYQSIVKPLATDLIGFKEIHKMNKLYIHAIIKNNRRLISWLFNHQLMKNHKISMIMRIHNSSSPAFF